MRSHMLTHASLVFLAGSLCEDLIQESKWAINLPVPYSTLSDASRMETISLSTLIQHISEEDIPF